MKIFIPKGTLKQFCELSVEYGALHKELEEEPGEPRRTEIIERIVDISKQFEEGIRHTEGYESSQ